MILIELAMTEMRRIQLVFVFPIERLQWMKRRAVNYVILPVTYVLYIEMILRVRYDLSNMQ